MVNASFVFFQQEFIELHARHCAGTTKMNKIVLVPSELPGQLGSGEGWKDIYFYIHNALYSGQLVVETLNLLIEECAIIRVCTQERTVLLLGQKKKMKVDRRAFGQKEQRGQELRVMGKRDEVLGTAGSLVVTD